jgi:hypothetical protein
MLRSFFKASSSCSRPEHFFCHLPTSSLVFWLDVSRSVRASSKVAVSCFSAKRCFSIVRMRASWSSTSCACAISLLWWRDAGGEAPLVCGGGLPGSGGRGIAGGGDGSELWLVLERTLELLEFDRCRFSRGSMDSRWEARFASVS